MFRKLSTASGVFIACVSLILLGAVPKAHANEITLGGSSPFGSGITFTVTTPGVVSVAWGTLLDSAANANYVPTADFGTYTLGATAFTLTANGATAATTMKFAVSGQALPEAFSYNTTPIGTDADNPGCTPATCDKMIGTITWSYGLDRSNEPRLFGLLSITALTGDAVFTSNWGLLAFANSFATTPITGTSPGADYTTFDNFAFSPTGSVATAGLSTGELDPTPEPSSLVLLGIGLIGLSLWARRKII